MKNFTLMPVSRYNSQSISTLNDYLQNCVLKIVGMFGGEIYIFGIWVSGLDLKVEPLVTVSLM